METKTASSATGGRVRRAQRMELRASQNQNSQLEAASQANQRLVMTEQQHVQAEGEEREDGQEAVTIVTKQRVDAGQESDGGGDIDEDLDDIDEKSQVSSSVRVSHTKQRALWAANEHGEQVDEAESPLMTAGADSASSKVMVRVVGNQKTVTSSSANRAYESAAVLSVHGRSQS